MVILGGRVFLMSEVTLYSQVDFLGVRYKSVNSGAGKSSFERALQTTTPERFDDTPCTTYKQRINPDHLDQAKVAAAARNRLYQPNCSTPRRLPPPPALEATQGQMDGSFSELPYKCHLEKVASVGD